MPYWDEKGIEGIEAIRGEVLYWWPTAVIPETATTAKWEHSSFSDPGNDDWNKLHVYDASGIALIVFHQDGF